MKKIKLLFVLPSLNGGGAERIVCNLMNAIDKNLFEVTLFLFANKGEYWDLINKDINICLGTQNIKTNKFNTIIQLYKAAKDKDIIIGCMELMPTYMSVIVAKLLRKKVIGWVHINLDSIILDKRKVIGFLHKYLLVKLFYNKLNKIIAVSKGAKINIENYLYNKNLKEVICIYNPIDIKYILQKSLEKPSVDFNNNLPIIMGIGRLERQKNFSLLIKAHKILLDQGIKQKLVILGEGSLKDKLLAEIKELRLNDSVELLGFKKNPYKYLRKADLFVQSSIYEGLPTVLIEALTLGVPVVATDCPDGASEILDKGKYGVLARSNDAEDLSDKIAQILLDRDLYNKYKDKSREAISRFDNKSITKKFEKVFLRLL